MPTSLKPTNGFDYVLDKINAFEASYPKLLELFARFAVDSKITGHIANQISDASIAQIFSGKTKRADMTAESQAIWSSRGLGIANLMSKISSTAAKKSDSDPVARDGFLLSETFRHYLEDRKYFLDTAVANKTDQKGVGHFSRGSDKTIPRDPSDPGRPIVPTASETDAVIMRVADSDRLSALERRFAAIVGREGISSVSASKLSGQGRSGGSR